MKKDQIKAELTELAGVAASAFAIVAGPFSGASFDTHGNYLAGQNAVLQLVGKFTK